MKKRKGKMDEGIGKRGTEQEAERKKRDREQERRE
jgi:hypothetical protein